MARSFDLTNYSEEERNLLLHACKSINGMIHLHPWEFIAMDGLMKEYSSCIKDGKADIVDSLFTNLTSKDIFKNAWVLLEITYLAKLSTLAKSSNHELTQ